MVTMKAPYLALLLTLILAGCTPSDRSKKTNITLITSNASIQWQAPTEDIDNQPLDSIQAYKIFYGHTPGDYSNRITITDGTKEEVVINNLELGEYYFVMSAISSNGTESELSNEMFVQIDQ